MPDDQTNPNQTPNPEAPSSDVPTPGQEGVTPTPSSAPTPQVSGVQEVTSPTVQLQDEQTPVATPAQTPVVGEGEQAPKPSSKKKWILGGVIAGLIVVLGGAGAWAYTAYQDPNKVIVDSVVNLLTDKNPSKLATTVTVKIMTCKRM